VSQVFLPETEVYQVELSQDMVSGEDIQLGKDLRGAASTLLCFGKVESRQLYNTQHVHQKLQEWNRPRKRTLKPQHVDEIKFIKHEHGKIKREHTKMVYDPRPQHLQHTANNEVEQFVQDCSLSASHVGSYM
jgi:hypothetical protein